MFNGTGKIIKSRDIDNVIYTDAYGKGFGGYIDSHSDYFFCSLENCSLSPCAHVENGPVFDDVHKSICQKELWPVLIACKRLGKILKGNNVLVYADNQSVMSMINSGRSKDIHAMSMLREIFWICFVFNFNLSAKYVKGIDNIEADFLSRLFAFSPKFLMTNLFFFLLSSCCRTSVLTGTANPGDLSASKDGLCR